MLMRAQQNSCIYHLICSEDLATLSLILLLMNTRMYAQMCNKFDDFMTAIIPNNEEK